MAEPDGSDGDVTARFAQSLSALKRRGSNLLVVGTAGTGSQISACRRLLGEERDGPRRRLFVMTDTTVPVADRLCGRPDADSLSVVDWDTSIRGAAASAPASTAGPDIPGGDDLVSLERTIAAEIDDLEGDGLEPAVLRVCVDSLRPLLAEHDQSEVDRFLGAVTARVRDARGMGHFHLPVEYDSGPVRSVSGHFDAVLEVRETGIAQQRWHLLEEDLTTGWLPLQG